MCSRESANHLKEMRKMVEDKAKALQELLEMIAKNPTLAERITITIKPGKVLQGTDEPENK